MRISFSPVVSSAELTLSRIGDTLVINGDALSFDVLNEGDEVPAAVARELHPALNGPIRKIGGVIHLDVILPLDPGCADPWMTFPDPVEVTGDGPVDVPWATYEEVSQAAVEGGTNVTTTTHRWHQEPVVTTIFVPNDEEAN